MFDRPLLLWLLLSLPLVVAPGVLAVGAGKRLAGAASTAIRFVTFVAIVMVPFCHPECQRRISAKRWIFSPRLTPPSQVAVFVEELLDDLIVAQAQHQETVERTRRLIDVVGLAVLSPLKFEAIAAEPALR